MPDDPTNLVEVHIHSHIYTTTVCKHCNYEITSLGSKRWRQRAALCTCMTSVTLVRQTNCIKRFEHLPVRVEEAYIYSKLYIAVPILAHAHVARYLDFDRKSKVGLLLHLPRSDLEPQCYKQPHLPTKLG